MVFFDPKNRQNKEIHQKNNIQYLINYNVFSVTALVSWRKAHF